MKKGSPALKISNSCSNGNALESNLTIYANTKAVKAINMSSTNTSQRGIF